MLKEDNKKKHTKSFVEAEIYKDKFKELLNKSQIFQIMICNDIVLRINRIHSHYEFYVDMRNKYSKGIIRDDAGQLDDFLVVEEIIYHSRKAIDQMIYSLWMNKVGVSNIDKKQIKPIDSIGKYLNQKIRLVDGFDEYLVFFNEINILSNSYKHSINTFSHLSHSEEKPAFRSYAISKLDSDTIIIQENLLKTLQKVFDKFLSLI